MNEGEGRGRNRKGDEKREEREGKVEERGRKEKWRRGGECERKGRSGHAHLKVDHEQNHATLPHLESAEGVFGGKVHSLWLSLVAGQPLPCATVGL